MRNLKARAEEIAPALKYRQHFNSKTLYHRGMIDELLVEAILRRLEISLLQLEDGVNWAVVLYLYYAPEDRNTFNLWEVRSKLKAAIVEKFKAEARRVFGARGTRKQLEDYALKEWGYSIRFEDSNQPLRCRLKASLDSAVHCADVELYLCEATLDVSARGRFAAIVRALPIISDVEQVWAVLAFDREGSVAPHICLRQRNINGRKDQIYLTDQVAFISAGPYLGCDVFVPSLRKLMRIDCQKLVSEKEDLGSRGQNTPNALTLVGGKLERVQNPTVFGSLINDRGEVCDFNLKVVARVLPRAESETDFGYGIDWCDLSLRQQYRTLVSVRLNEDGDALAVDERKSIFVWHSHDGQPEEISEQGLIVKIQGRPYRWEPDTSTAFHGSLYFPEEAVDAPSIKRRTTILPAEQPLRGLISRGSFDAPGVVPMLADYRDDELVSHRGSLIVYSDGQGNFELSLANTSAQRNIFVRTREKIWCHHNIAMEGGQPVKLLPPYEFVFGTSLYKITMAGNSYRLYPHWSGNYLMLTTLNENKLYSGS